MISKLEVTCAKNEAEEKETPGSPRPYRFDIFKGEMDECGKIKRLKSVGTAYRREGCKTFTLHIHTFLGEVFYMLPGFKDRNQSDFVLLTRELSHLPNKKFFWNLVGEGRLVCRESAGTIHLVWDMLGAADIYMSLYPKDTLISHG